MNNEACKVLVVENNRDSADSTVMLLELWGHQAVAAYLPQDAVATAREFQPDVVLMDIGLPGMNGFTLAKKLQEICTDCRIVALTGFTQADIVRRAEQVGFADYLVKPAEPAAVKEVVDGQCLRRS